MHKILVMRWFIIVIEEYLDREWSMAAAMADPTCTILA